MKRNPHMIVARASIEKTLPIIATTWFFVVLNSYLVWNTLAPVIHFLPALLIVWGTFLISDRLSSSRYHRILFLGVMLYYCWIVISMCDTIGSVVKRGTDFIPLLCIILWPREILLKTYLIIRKIVVFFSIGSAIITILILLGLNDRIPHIVLPPREALHVKIGMTYYLYGLFIADCHPVMGVSSRACGMLQEPGHFAILLGFIFLIDRFRGQKICWWIVICGLLTFSSTFILLALFTEMHHLFSLKNLKKMVMALPLLLLFFVVSFKCLPTDIQEQIEYFAYGRNLESVVEAFKETSSLTGALDERASDYAIASYEKMSTMQYIFGGGQKEAGEMLSDYRGMILHMGIVGIFLSTMSYLLIIVGSPGKMKMALVLTYSLIIIHRAWMLDQPYIFILAYFAVFIYKTGRIKTNYIQANYKDGK